MATSTRSSPQRSRMEILRRMGIGVVLANVFVGGLICASLQESLRNYQERAEVDTNNLAHTIRQYLLGVFERIDYGLFDVSYEIEHELRQGGIDAPVLNRYINQHKARQPELSAIVVSNARGDLLFGNLPSFSPVSNISDRGYFIRQREEGGGEMLISGPFVSKVGGKWSLFFSRRINTPDGLFFGVVISILPLDSIAKFFAAIDVGHHGGISLRDKDMAIIVRYPDPEGSFRGNSNISSELKNILEGDKLSGTYFSGSTWDGMARTVSFNKIGEYPMYVNVGMSPEDYLKPWKIEAFKFGSFYLIFILLTTFGATAFYRSWRRRIEADESARRTLEARVRESTASLREYSEALERSNAELRNLAITDALTGIANRRRFMEVAAMEVERTRRHGHSLSMMMLDIDHFKNINDNWGHATGDEAIKATANCCIRAIRTGDLAGRIGGEEFAILLPETTLPAAQAVAERLLQSIAAIHLRFEDDTIQFTASIGVSELIPGDASAEVILSRADQALYQAKESGRNRVVCKSMESRPDGAAMPSRR